MKVIVDSSRCEAHGDCVLAAPTVFDIDDDSNVVILLQEEPGEQLRDQVEAAERLCPAAAIKIEG